MPDLNSTRDDAAAVRRRIMLAALENVPFEGWSAANFMQACSSAGVDPGEARRLCPSVGIDLAVEFQSWGDDLMAESLKAEDLSCMGMSDRVATAIELRLKAVAGHREAVRRTMALFSLPLNAGIGGRSLWRTADRIWTELGDESDDYNWYTKRTTLSTVIGSSALYWLGDAEQGEATRAFIDRRIREISQIGKAKARLRNLPGAPRMMDAMEGLLRPLRPSAFRRRAGDDAASAGGAE